MKLRPHHLSHSGQGRSGFASCVLLLLAVAAPARALDALPDGSKGELTLTFTWKERIATRASDGYTSDTVIDRKTTAVCPLSSSADTLSAIDGATPAQSAAAARMGEAARAEVQAVSPGAMADMQALQKKMDACRKAGGNRQACAAQMMAAMQANPDLVEQMGRAGQANPGEMAAAERAVAGAGGKFQVWYNEGCRGTMTVNDMRKTVDPTLHASERTVTTTTTGSQPIDSRATLVTVETDLNKVQTRYMIVSPDASGFQEQSNAYGYQPKRLSASAMPAGVLIAGPFPGPINKGSHELRLAGGSVKIDWLYRPLR